MLFIILVTIIVYVSRQNSFYRSEYKKLMIQNDSVFSVNNALKDTIEADSIKKTASRLNSGN
jgi:hypothetical protein